MLKINRLFFFLVLISVSSCSVFKKNESQNSELNYMQNIEGIATEAALKNNYSSIQSGDQLVIYVSAKDLEVVKIFNQNYSTGETIVNAQAGGNTPSQGSVTVSGPTYTVDSEGNIDFPVLGKLSARGKTQEEFRDELVQRVSRYVINPSVNIKLANYKITVLGEVNRPGEYTIPDGKSTLLSALGLAGDLTMYGKRDDVLVVRNIDGVISKERLNLLDANFINSPFFYLKQGDVVYVSANQTKEKTSKLDPRTGIYIGVASLGLTAIAVLLSVFKK